MHEFSSRKFLFFLIPLDWKPQLIMEAELPIISGSGLQTPASSAT